MSRIITGRIDWPAAAGRLPAGRLAMAARLGGTHTERMHPTPPAAWPYGHGKCQCGGTLWPVLIDGHSGYHALMCDKCAQTAGGFCLEGGGKNG